jgi:hypothetical protein
MWNGRPSGGCRGDRILLASSSLSSPSSPFISPALHVAKGVGLPGEGFVYDSIGISNFIDLEKMKLTASLGKSITSNALSNVLYADLPTKVTVSGNLGNAWYGGLNFNPIGKVAVSVRLLDLGSPDLRQAGHLRFKAATRTNGRSDHGFDVDRKVGVMDLRDTMLYGNVAYRTNNLAKGEWKTTSSFGLHQVFRFGGVKFAARVGMTPEGEFVYDIRL